jgi:hypothetical protein
MGNQIVIGSMACVYKAGAWLRRYLNGDVEFLVEWNPWSHLYLEQHRYAAAWAGRLPNHAISRGR